AARDEAVEHRTRAINRLKAACHMHLGHTPGDLARPGHRAALQAVLEGAAASGAAPAAVVRVLGVRLEEIAYLSGQIAGLEEEVAGLAGPLTVNLRRITGVGPLVAAHLVAAVGDIARFASHDALAAFAGCAPVPVFSSGRDRVRLSRGGHRGLNSVFYRIAMVQVRHDERAREFVRSREEAKGRRGAYRVLKRKLVRR
ncbi:transposase, partial [Nocardiopsis baichengensis]|uniref:transposase n=1 Tax=Nocardiopsis baichengensis TaxID=280240 RepID=UPI00037FCB97